MIYSYIQMHIVYLEWLCTCIWACIYVCVCIYSACAYVLCVYIITCIKFKRKGLKLCIQTCAMCTYTLAMHALTHTRTHIYLSHIYKYLCICMHEHASNSHVNMCNVSQCVYMRTYIVCVCVCVYLCVCTYVHI